MLAFPYKSFEQSIFKTGKSGKEYDLSAEGIKKLSIHDIIDLLENDIFRLREEKNEDIEKLLKLLNKELLKFHSPDYFDLFGIKDPRKNELTKGEKELYTEESFPKNILTLLTHGTYGIPSEVRNEIKSEVKNIIGNESNVKKARKEKKLQIIRILKQFSDFGTRFLVKKSFIPKNQVIKATNSRLVGDPARDRNAKDFVKETDFYDNVVLSKPEKFRSIGEESHKDYHEKIEEKAKKIEQNQGGVIIIDDHDTGILNMGEKPSLDEYNTGGFPLITLGTQDGNSCNPEILEYYAQRIEFHLGIKPLINEPYKGGYVTVKHGVNYRKKLKENRENYKKRNVIQQEIGKFLYLDEKTQKVDKDKAELIGIGLARAKADLGVKFGKEYFENL